MAQNGAGFDKVAMQQVVKRYMKDGQINWQAFFKTRGWKENYTDIRAIGRENFDTRYMVYLYATDLYALYLLGWELPKGITEDDLFEMMKLGWGTNEKSYEAK